MINKDVILGDAETYYKKLVRKIQEYEQLEEKHKKLIADYKTLLNENDSLIDECNTCKYKYYKNALKKIKEILTYYANSSMGVKNIDGTFSLKDEQEAIILNYDPRKAQEGLIILNEVKE